MRRALSLFFVLLAALTPIVATAQAPIARVVAACGTPPPAYPAAGFLAELTVDVNGNLCTPISGGGGGSVTQGTVPWADNIAQWGGTTVNIGQQLKAASIPVTIASDQGALGSVSLTGTLPAFAAVPTVNLGGTLPAFASTPTFTIGGTLPAYAATPAFTQTDGTNTANILAATSASNIAGAQAAALTAGAFKEVSFTTTTAQAVATTDVSNYKWVSVHTTSQGGSSSVQFQGSNDNSNWTSVALISLTGVGATVPAVSTNATGIFAGPVSFRYFRLNVTAIVSGTTAGVIELYTAAPGVVSSGVAASLDQINGVTAAIAASGVLKVGVSDSTGGALTGLSGDLQVYQAPVAAPTTTVARIQSAATTNATSLKATAAGIFFVDAGNSGAADAWIKFYAKASAPTVGTDTPVWTMYLPKGTRQYAQMDVGYPIATGLAYAITGGAGDTDTTAVLANQVTGTIGYK